MGSNSVGSGRLSLQQILPGFAPADSDEDEVPKGGGGTFVPIEDVADGDDQRVKQRIG